MRYVIDGHNLIPLVVKGGLENPEKERVLLDLLRSPRLHRAHEIHVFFDKAPAGRAGVRREGKLVIHQVQASLAADDAILQFLFQCGKQAAEYTVVSSDHRVESGAKRLRARVSESHIFADLLRRAGENEGRSREDTNGMPADQKDDIWEHFLRKEDRN